jgi:serine/threonine-protein kinase HipA
MRQAKIYVDNKEAGILTEYSTGKSYEFTYLEAYSGSPVSLTLPLRSEAYNFTDFPPFFEGLLPEGFQLEGLLKIGKIDRNDLFSQLISVGDDLVGNVTVKEIQA